jgi:uncharacterized protein YndB with AHSA1/START domain
MTLSDGPYPPAGRRHAEAGYTAAFDKLAALVGDQRPGSDTVRRVAVDVVTCTEIARPRTEVAGYAADPDNAPRWYKNITSVEWKSSPPLAVGSRVAFVARFLGRRLAYTYEIREFVPGERLVMSTEQGPFPMQTTYVWEDTVGGGTRMTLRNRGEPTGFSKLAAPMVARAVRHANRKDLARLKAILEGSQDPATTGSPSRGNSSG